jgi:hypothetical protein
LFSSEESVLPGPRIIYGGESMLADFP